MLKTKLNRLSQEIVNQIAAGEVIERPVSVVKELLDNAIDAEAKKITVKVRGGGIEMIEISDDGYGIPKENMDSVFDAHTTSKIANIEDLNFLMSMGFRGEALSTITAVARVTLISKFVDESVANEIRYDENGKSEVKSSAKEKGTTVKVEDLFYNIPARKKYLKSAQTEYRKIVELLNRYFLVFPEINFVLEKDGKVVENLQCLEDISNGDISLERVKKVTGQREDTDWLPLHYDGSGMKISGYIAHPSSHKSKTGQSYIFLNNRPISDKGITRAVYEGYSRYLPFGEKISFVINLHCNPDIVDVNVHPRKEEVRFENPFRVYSAVEESVRHSLEKELSYKNTSVSKESSFSLLRDTFNSQSKQYKQMQPANSYMGKKHSSIQDSLLFSKELLNSSSNEPQAREEIQNNYESPRTMFQIFNKYIVVEFPDERLWIIDQHAAAERINFEKLQKRKQNTLDIQNLLVPTIIKFSSEELLFLDENSSFFKDLGFAFTVEKESISISSVPAEFVDADFTLVFQEIFELEDSLELLRKNFTKRQEDVLATIACHGSVRSGQKLSYIEMTNIFKELSECENPYSCPHGRPAIWKLTLDQIDHNFERTY